MPFFWHFRYKWWSADIHGWWRIAVYSVTIKTNEGIRLEDSVWNYFTRRRLMFTCDGFVRRFWAATATRPQWWVTAWCLQFTSARSECCHTAYIGVQSASAWSFEDVWPRVSVQVFVVTAKVPNPTIVKMSQLFFTLATWCGYVKATNVKIELT
jgi:hypothetical protein